MKRKIVTLVLAVMMALSFVACGNTPENNSSEENEKMTEQEIEQLYADPKKFEGRSIGIDKRIREETEKIKTMANPEKEIERYFRHLRWRTPELALYVRFQMLNILNLYD